MSRVVSLFEQYVKLSNNLHYDAMIAAVRVDDPGKLADTIAAHLLVGVDEKQNLLEIISPDRAPEPHRRHPRSRGRQAPGRSPHPVSREEADGEGAEGVLPQREDEGDPEGTGPQGREGQRGRRAEEEDRTVEDAEGRRGEGHPGAEAPRSDAADVGRSDRLAQLPRLADRGALAQEDARRAATSKRAEEILNEDHYGLEKIKDRILEFLAVRALVKKPKATILTFSGPPGVGKTSLAKSIARAMNRKFVRLSLGGVRDEAEIRGHRRTYIGAFPGQIIQMMKKAGTMNPVFLLDEVDKMSMDFRGDPSAALLEVLDPGAEQHVPRSLPRRRVRPVERDVHLHGQRAAHDPAGAARPHGSAAAGRLHRAGEGRDRQEVPRRRRRSKAPGSPTTNITFPDEAFQTIIQRYTREAGVRNLEREISSICRKVARKVVVEGKDVQRGDHRRQGHRVPRRAALPPDDGRRERTRSASPPGLAWTEVGGEILVTEATLMPGKGHLTLTGKLGDVMQESAQAAMSYVRSKAEEFGIPKDFNRKTDVHVHVPEGAIPKDGPSAGITLATALVSALARVPTRKDVAMTGEITLRGKVLPIGGVKEKLLAAHRAGLKTIIVPKDNEKDLADIPKNVLDTLDIYMVETMDEVLKIALAGPLPGPRRRGDHGRRGSRSRHFRRHHYALMLSALGARGSALETGARASTRSRGSRTFGSNPSAERRTPSAVSVEAPLR